MKKYSPHREALLISLKNRNDHPTADTLYFELKQKFPSISLATVYRNLIDLANDGEIQKLQIGNGADCFDGNINDHMHFICEKCNKIIDISIDDKYKDYTNDYIKPHLNRIGGKVEKYNIILSGICYDCEN